MTSKQSYKNIIINLDIKKEQNFNLETSKTYIFKAYSEHADCISGCLSLLNNLQG